MTKRELGLQRYRFRRRILDALEEQHPPLDLNDIAEHLGITLQAVRRTWAGELHSQRVLQAFRDAGVPEEYLFDPRMYGMKMRGYGLAAQQPAVL